MYTKVQINYKNEFRANGDTNFHECNIIVKRLTSRIKMMRDKKEIFKLL